MGEAAYSVREVPNNIVELVVHVNEMLGGKQRDELVSALEEVDGIKCAEFCPLRFHLMLVQYNREMMTSQDVLGRVTQTNVHAQLVGPV